MDFELFCRSTPPNIQVFDRTNPKFITLKISKAIFCAITLHCRQQWVFRNDFFESSIKNCSVFFPRQASAKLTDLEWISKTWRAIANGLIWMSSLTKKWKRMYVRKCFVITWIYLRNGWNCWWRLSIWCRRADVKISIRFNFEFGQIDKADERNAVDCVFLEKKNETRWI